MFRLVRLTPALDGHQPIESFGFVGWAKSFAIAVALSLADAVGQHLHFAIVNEPVDVALERRPYADFVVFAGHFVVPIIMIKNSKF